MKIRSADFFESKTRVFLFLLIPTVLVYIKSLWFGFTQLDEKWLILDHVEHLKLWSSLPGSFTSALYNLYYRPLLAVSIFVDYHIGGLSPFIYHFTNLFWHLVSVFFLFKLLVLFEVPRKNAAFLTLLFSVHPMLVHAVAWIPGRNDTMLCAFTLSALIYLKKYLQQQQTKYLVLNILFFMCALLTKENAVGLLVLFFFILYGERTEKKNSVVFLLWTVVAGLWLLLRYHAVSATAVSSLSFSTRILNSVAGFFIYTGKCFFPFPQSVSPIIELQTLVMGVIAFVLLLFLFFRPGVFNRKTALTGLLLFFILLVIPLWFNSGKSEGELYEHRVYTPLCGLLLFISQVKFNLNSKILFLLFSSVLIFFFVKTFFRMNVYKDADTFLLVAIKERPGYFLFEAQYATYLCAEGNYSSAIPYYTRAISQRPDKHQMYKDRAYAYFLLGNFKEAINDLNTAIAKSGFKLDYYLDRCAVYNASNDLENTFKDFTTLMNCCEASIPKELRTAVAKHWQLAMGDLNHKLALQANNDTLLFQRAKLYFYVGEKEKGLDNLKKALSISPQNPEYLKLVDRP